MDSKYYWIYWRFLCGGRLGWWMGYKVAINSAGANHILVRNVPGISDELLLKYGVWNEPNVEYAV